MSISVINISAFAAETGSWKHHALGLLIMLVLMAFGLAIAAYLFDLDDVFEGRKINFLVVRSLRLTVAPVNGSR